MNIKKISAFITLSLMSFAGQAAQAGTLYNGWNYAIDPSYDSLAAGNGPGGITAGNTIYEIYGMAIKDDVDSNSIWVAINSNLPITGHNTGPVAENGHPISNGNIGWGDLLLDFSGLGNFKAANDSSSLLAVRFAANNDSKTSSTGVFENVKAVSVVAQNDGWSNLYNQNEYGVLPRAGKDGAVGDLAWNDPYYSAYNSSAGAWSQPTSLIPNIIGSGTKIGDITLVSNSDLIAAGFAQNFLPASGTPTFGFKFDKSLLPTGNYIASLFLECNNDAIALKGNTSQKVPEPSSALGLIAVGLVFGMSRIRKGKLGCSAN